MYDWRKMTDEQRQQTLSARQLIHRPWHSPPHNQNTNHTRFHLTAACYEHRHHIGNTHSRIINCERSMINTISETSFVYAWCLLTNHWHVLIKTEDLQATLNAMNNFHGRTSGEWNLEDSQIGRKVWCNILDRQIKSEAHFWATINYIHNNPIRHNYCAKWQEWPFSSANEFLSHFGRDRAEYIWRKYNIDDMGGCWDNS